MRFDNKNVIYIFLFSNIIAVLIAHFAFDLLFKTELIQSGNNIQTIYQKPFYGFMVVPGTGKSNTGTDNINSPPDSMWHLLHMVSPDSRQGLNGSLGADFSQVYFSAMALRHGESQYEPQNIFFRDRFGRRPGYPPFTNWLYVPVTYLPYHVALVVHNYGTLLLFILLSALMMRMFHLQKYIFMVIVLYYLLYFHTPLGYAHFERGQFDLFLSASYLLLFSCILIKNNFLPALASGLLGALKWSSAPFIGTFSAMAFFAENRKKRWIFVLPLGVMCLSVLVFFEEIKDYWPSIQTIEFMATPQGTTFLYLMPPAFAKSLQIGSCLIVLILMIFRHKGPQRFEIFKKASLPFALAMFIQGNCYGTTSYEYRIVSILGLVPVFLFWVEQADTLPYKIKMMVSIFFSVFVILSFRTFHFFIWDWPTLGSPGMTLFYLISSVIFLLFACHIVYDRNRGFSHLNQPPVKTTIS